MWHCHIYFHQSVHIFSAYTSFCKMKNDRNFRAFEIDHVLRNIFQRMLYMCGLQSFKNIAIHIRYACISFHWSFSSFFFSVLFWFISPTVFESIERLTLVFSSLDRFLQCKITLYTICHIYLPLIRTGCPIASSNGKILFNFKSKR